MTTKHIFYSFEGRARQYWNKVVNSKLWTVCLDETVFTMETVDIWCIVILAACFVTMILMMPRQHMSLRLSYDLCISLAMDVLVVLVMVRTFGPPHGSYVWTTWFVRLDNLVMVRTFEQPSLSCTENFYIWWYCLVCQVLFLTRSCYVFWMWRFLKFLGFAAPLLLALFLKLFEYTAMA